MKEEISYDKLLKKIPNKYELTIVAGKRARDLGQGKEALIKTDKKATIIKKALLEILSDKIGICEYKDED